MANESFLLSFHRDLVSDAATQGRFRDAIRRGVREGDRVLDLGAGTGLHAVFACRAGASRVYAIESDRVIDLAGEIVAANGCGERVELIRGMSSEVELPEKVDVIVANLGFDASLRYLPDVVRRFLAPGGRVIPDSMELLGAPVHDADAYRRDVSVWKEGCLGVDLSPVWTTAVHTVHVGRFGVDALLGRPESLIEVDLSSPAAPEARGGSTWEVSRRGTLHGIATWYVQHSEGRPVAALAPPLELPYPLWHHSFFPVREPVAVETGDRVDMELRLSPFAEAGTHLAWEVRVHGRAGVVSRHSTLEGMPLSRSGLKRRAPDHRPVVGPRGRAASAALALADGERTLGGIEREVFRRFPELFDDVSDAAAFVSKVLGDHGA